MELFVEGSRFSLDKDFTPNTFFVKWNSMMVGIIRTLLFINFKSLSISYRFYVNFIVHINSLTLGSNFSVSSIFLVTYKHISSI